MTLGYSYKGTVQIGTLNLGECDVTFAIDGTMTVHFDKGDISLDTLDTVFQASPSVAVTTPSEIVTYESRELQAYRVQADGKAEVSFLSNLINRDEIEVETVESEATDE